VPETFGAKIQIKEKKGRIETKLQWRWSTLADYAHPEREQYNAWLTSMKSVKKKMGSSFKELSRAAEAGKFPDNKSVDEFVATCRVFAEAADPEWKEAMEEYMDHLENFIRAIEKQQFEVMLHEIRDLSYRMKACHKEFK
jgi:XXXCH domain-containing protein